MSGVGVKTMFLHSESVPLRCSASSLEWVALHFKLIWSAHASISSASEPGETQCPLLFIVVYHATNSVSAAGVKKQFHPMLQFRGTLARGTLLRGTSADRIPSDSKCTRS